jgi:hypothetical protein
VTSFVLTMTFASTSGGLFSLHDMLMQGQRGAGGLALPIRHPALQECGCLAPLCGRFALGKERVFIGQERGEVSGPVWAVRKISRSAGIRSPDHPSLNDRYTDYAVPAAIFKGIFGKTRKFQLLAYIIL